MEKIEFTIIVETEKKLTDDEVKHALVDMQHRLMGYKTQTPKCLEKADIVIGIKKKKS